MALSTLPSPSKTVLPHIWVSSSELEQEIRSACVAGDWQRFQERFRAWLNDESCSNIQQLGRVMIDAIQYHRPEIIRALLDEGMRVELLSVLEAIKYKSKDILHIYLQYGWDVNAPRSVTEPPVLGYITDREMIIWLLDHGADPNAACSIDLTAMSFAVKFASVDVIELLLDRGADVHKGQLLHHALDRKTDVLEVMDLLVTKGAPISERMYEKQKHPIAWGLYYFMGLGTPLHKAAESGNIDAVRYLISRGADVAIPDQLGQSVLDCAARQGYPEIVDLLRSEIKN